MAIDYLRDSVGCTVVTLFCIRRFVIVCKIFRLHPPADLQLNTKKLGGDGCSGFF